MHGHRRDSAWSDDSDAVTRWLGPPPEPTREGGAAETLRPDVIAALSSAADSCLLRRSSSRRSATTSSSAASSSSLLAPPPQPPVAHRSGSPLHSAAPSITARRSSHPSCLPHVVYSGCLRPMPVSDCSLPLQTAGELAACRSGGGGGRRISACDDVGAAAADDFPPPPNSEASASVASDGPLFLEGSEASAAAAAAAAAAATSPVPQPRPPLAVGASFPRHHASTGLRLQPHAPPSWGSSDGVGEPSLRAQLSTSTASLLQELRRVQEDENEAAAAAETSVARQHLSSTAVVAAATPYHHTHHHHHPHQHHHRRSFGGYAVAPTTPQLSHAAVAHRSSRPLQQLSVNGVNNRSSVAAAAARWGCGGVPAGRWAAADGEAAEEVVVVVSPERVPPSPGSMVGPAALSPVRSPGGCCSTSAVALLESKLLAAQRTLRSRSGGRGRRRSSGGAGGDDLFW